MYGEIFVSPTFFTGDVFKMLFLLRIGNGSYLTVATRISKKTFLNDFLLVQGFNGDGEFGYAQFYLRLVVFI